MFSRRNPLQWVNGYTFRTPGIVANTYTATYHLTNLIKRGLVDATEARQMLDDTGLADFKWQITWPEDYPTPDDDLLDRIGNVQGYAIFIHGWTGNHKIWEELPGMVCMANRRMVSIAIDHNGFGDSIFTTHTPELSQCNPPAAMRALEKWLDVVKLRRQPGDTQLKVINLIGHSMGGAMLFYANPLVWREGELTRYALAPALLLEAEQNRRFFTTLGVGISILQRVKFLEFVERFIKPSMLRNLCAGGSVQVKEIHNIQYNETPRGITGATFMAMGLLNDYEIARNFEFFRVMLGHRDPLVDLTDMLDLLCKLEFPAAHTRVVAGTHYMFSIGSESSYNAFQHVQARDLVVEDILQLHDDALKLQRTGRRVG
jgi:hypothetical protein